MGTRRRGALDILPPQSTADRRAKEYAAGVELEQGEPPTGILYRDSRRGDRGEGGREEGDDGASAGMGRPC